MPSSDHFHYLPSIDVYPSPSLESFSDSDTSDQTYLTDLCNGTTTTLPDYDFEDFIEHDSFFDYTMPGGQDFLPSVSDYSPLFAPEVQFPCPESPWRKSPTYEPFGTLDGAFTTGDFVLDAPQCVSPIKVSSPTETLHPTPPASPLSLKRKFAFPEVKTENPLVSQSKSQPAPPKRGRPRLPRAPSPAPALAPLPSKANQRRQCTRLPHNQVERKYREGLNNELERLRRAVPTLLQSERCDVMGVAKPSKAMVLAAAIEYIQSVEREKELLTERLRGARRGEIWNE